MEVPRLSIVVSLVLISALLAHAAPVYFADTGHWYETVGTPNGIGFLAAKAAAEARGGYLAVITSLDENEFIYYQAGADQSEFWFLDGAGNYEGPWIGGFQTMPASEPSGNWTWVNGETWSWTHWANGEPNNSGGNEHYANFFYKPNEPTREGFWNDVPEQAGLFGYVVEYDVPEPATLALLALGALTLRRRR